MTARHWFFLTAVTFAALVESLDTNGIHPNLKIPDNFKQKNLFIIGGETSYLGQFPYMVSIQLKLEVLKEFYHFCGGAIINENWVLTAAHCLREVTANEISVIAGEQNLEKVDGFEQRRNVIRMISHYNFTKFWDGYDIGLIKVAEPFDFSTPYVSPISLPEENQEFSGNCVVSGWGHTDDTHVKDSPDEMQFVDVPLMSFETCRGFWGKLNFIESMLCAGYKEGQRDFCVGDSGGPLVCEDEEGNKKVAGIVSFTSKVCAIANRPGVYTKVASFLTWIKLRI